MKFLQSLLIVLLFFITLYYLYGFKCTIDSICCYYLISYFFLKYPYLLHKKQKFKNQFLNSLVNSNKVATMTHRGGS